MSNYDYINDIIINFSGIKQNIVIPKIYLEITGDYQTGAFLNQLIFWSDKSKRKDGYFYKRYDEWHDELFVSDYQIRRMTKKLEDMNFITTALKKANGTPTKHYKVNMDEIQKAIIKKLNKGKLKNSTIDYEKTSQSMDYEKTSQSLTDEYTYNYNSENTTVSTEQVGTVHPPYKEIIKYLNEKAGKNFNYKAKSNRKLISGRFNEGNSVEVFKHVIDVKVVDWLNDDAMRTYLKPETLFNSTNFEKYKNETIDEVKARREHWNGKRNNNRNITKDYSEDANERMKNRLGGD